MACMLQLILTAFYRVLVGPEANDKRQIKRLARRTDSCAAETCKINHHVREQRMEDIRDIGAAFISGITSEVRRSNHIRADRI
jgi:hypothetical protein